MKIETKRFLLRVTLPGYVGLGLLIFSNHINQSIAPLCVCTGFILIAYAAIWFAILGSRGEI